MARFLAIHDVSGLTEEEFDAHIASGQTRRVSLREPLPAFLEYVTVRADSNGRMVFLPDIYDYDPWNQDDIAGDRSGQSKDQRYN